jgi:hypothetical protein
LLILTTLPNSILIKYQINQMITVLKNKSTFALLVAVISIVATTTGCKGKKDIDNSSDTNSTEYITIKKSDTATIKLSEVFHKIKLIPLKNNEAGAKKLDKIIFHKDKIFIMDREIGKGIFMYDANGHFLMRIGTVGKGIEDVENLSDFDINDDNIIVSEYPNKLFVYDVGGKLLNEKQLKFEFSSFISIPGGYLFYDSYRGGNNDMGTDNYNIIRTDLKLKFQQGYLPYQAEMMKNSVVSYPSNFQRIGNEILFSQSFTNVVYAFKNNKLEKKVKIKFEYIPLPEKISKNFISPKTINEIFNAPYAHLMAPFYDNANYGVYRCAYAGKDLYLLRTPHRSIMINDLQDDFYGVPNYSFCGAIDENRLLGSINWDAAYLMMTNTKSSYLEKGNPYKVKLDKLLKEYQLDLERPSPVIAVFEFGK